LIREGNFAKYKELRTANRDLKFGKHAEKLASGKQPFTVGSDITYTGERFYCCVKCFKIIKLSIKLGV
jgi:hypothetical protein